LCKRGERQFAALLFLELAAATMSCVGVQCELPPEKSRAPRRTSVLSASQTLLRFASIVAVSKGVTKTILLLENVEDDVFVFRRALLTLKFPGNVRVVRSLAEARNYMLGAGPFCDRNYFPIPDLIVCDFGLGGERGTDFVRWLKEHPEYGNIPVVLFSGSIPQREIPAVLEQFKIPLHKKEVDFEVTTDVVKEILGYMEPPADGTCVPPQ
jgi:CheY-like chemotaxis protein